LCSPNSNGWRSPFEGHRRSAADPAGRAGNNGHLSQQTFVRSWYRFDRNSLLGFGSYKRFLLKAYSDNSFFWRESKQLRYFGPSFLYDKTPPLRNISHHRLSFGKWHLKCRDAYRETHSRLKGKEFNQHGVSEWRKPIGDTVQLRLRSPLIGKF
jgi:hypothetical protein